MIYDTIKDKRKEYKVIKPFSFKIDKEYCEYKYDFYNFKVDDVVTITLCPTVNRYNIWLKDKNMSFIGEIVEDIENYVKEINYISFDNCELRKILAEKYNCKSDDIVFNFNMDKDFIINVGFMIKSE